MPASVPDPTNPFRNRVLEHLRIEHLILVRQALLPFDEGLNILTGETGAGKSAILAAIRLLAGEKADPQLIRTGSDLAIVEGKIRIEFETLARICEEEGLPAPAPHESCLIRRELHRSGKSRAFFNDQQISLSVLRQFLSKAIELVDQNSSQQICAPLSQRRLLDLWAGIDLTRFAEQFARQKTVEKEIQRLKAEKERADAMLARSAAELEEIEEVSWKSGEDAALSEEHHRLSHAGQLIERLDSISRDLSETPLAAQLRKLASSLEQQASFDRTLAEAADLLKSASLETQEAESIVQRALHKLEVDPARLEQVELRIGAIEKIKRRFGASFEAIESLKQSLKAKIADLEQLDDTVHSLEKELQHLSLQNLQSAKELSQQRVASALPLQTKLVEELSSLNLPHARFAIEIRPKELSSDGADVIRFLFSANPGQPLLPLDECASGGEQSRLLFAFKVLFAEKEECPCLIFDEIDSNVGGQTASILGQKLQTLATGRQVICITHFVQVARFASHHFLVEKTTEKNQSSTIVQKLDLMQRELEYARMVGKS